MDKLQANGAISWLETLMSVCNEPLLSALASYERALRFKDKHSPWLNQQRWAAIRALLVATESETRRCLNKKSFLMFSLNFFPVLRAAKVGKIAGTSLRKNTQLRADSTLLNSIVTCWRL